MPRVAVLPFVIVIMRVYVALALLWSAPVRAVEPAFEAFIEPQSSLFPSLLLSTQTLAASSPARPDVLGDPAGLLGVRLTALRDQEQVSLQIAAPPLLGAVSTRFVLPRAGQRYTLSPRLHWNDSVLGSIAKRATVTVSFGVQRDSGPIRSQRLTATVYPVADALYYIDTVRNRRADDIDLNWIFAAYVDENSAAVDEILAGLDPTIGRRSPLEQVYAVWASLSARGIHYATLPTAPAARGLYTQAVRFPADTWKNGAANCVDGSVLLASVLQRLGLRPRLVVVPGHMWLGFARDKSRGDQFDADGDWYLETTALNTAPAARAAQPTAAQFGMAPRRGAAFQSYLRALQAGSAQFATHRRRFAQGDQADYQLIDIEAARGAGVLPIAEPGP